MTCRHPGFTRITSYMKGCRCADCVEEHRAYHRRYRAENPDIIRAIRTRAAERKARAEATP